MEICKNARVNLLAAIKCPARSLATACKCKPSCCFVSHLSRKPRNIPIAWSTSALRKVAEAYADATTELSDALLSCARVSNSLAIANPNIKTAPPAAMYPYHVRRMKQPKTKIGTHGVSQKETRP